MIRYCWLPISEYLSESTVILKWIWSEWKCCFPLQRNRTSAFIACLYSKVSSFWNIQKRKNNFLKERRKHESVTYNIWGTGVLLEAEKHRMVKEDWRTHFSLDSPSLSFSLRWLMKTSVDFIKLGLHNLNGCLQYADLHV